MHASKSPEINKCSGKLTRGVYIARAKTHAILNLAPPLAALDNLFLKTFKLTEMSRWEWNYVLEITGAREMNNGE